MAIGKENYRETIEAKKERFENLAQKNALKSVYSYKRVQEISSFIPLGQPILIGHHSEKRHRADANRIDNSMRQSVEASKKAEYYTDKAKVVGTSGISSDNPDALVLLEEKLKKLQDKQELMKACNAYYRKNKTLKGFVFGEIVFSDEKTETMDKNISQSRSKKPFEAYELSNNSQNMSATKKRIARLQVVDKMEESEIQGEGFCIVVNNEANRVQILFDSIPDEKVRTELKRFGFKWSPYNKAWQRAKSPQSLNYAKRVMQG